MKTASPSPKHPEDENSNIDKQQPVPNFVMLPRPRLLLFIEGRHEVAQLKYHLIIRTYVLGDSSESCFHGKPYWRGRLRMTLTAPHHSLFPHLDAVYYSPSSRRRAAHRAARRRRPLSKHFVGFVGILSASPRNEDFPPPCLIHKKRPCPNGKALCNNKFYSALKGMRAAMRARLMAVASSLWCFAQVPVMRRGRIFPPSATNFLSFAVSL